MAANKPAHIGIRRSITPSRAGAYYDLSRRIAASIDRGPRHPLTGAGGAEAVLVDLARAAPSAGLRLIVVGLSDRRIRHGD